MSRIRLALLALQKAQNDAADLARLSKCRNVVALVDACQKTVTRDKAIGVVGIDEFRASSQAVIITATSPGKASSKTPMAPTAVYQGIAGRPAGRCRCQR